MRGFLRLRTIFEPPASEKENIRLTGVVVLYNYKSTYKDRRNMSRENRRFYAVGPGVGPNAVILRIGVAYVGEAFFQIFLKN
jgi:hypothetical protein